MNCRSLKSRLASTGHLLQPLYSPRCPTSFRSLLTDHSNHHSTLFHPTCRSAFVACFRRHDPSARPLVCLPISCVRIPCSVPSHRISTPSPLPRVGRPATWELKQSVRESDDRGKTVQTERGKSRHDARKAIPCLGRPSLTQL